MKKQLIFIVYIVLSFCLIVRVTATSTEGKIVAKADVVSPTKEKEEVDTVKKIKAKKKTVTKKKIVEKKTETTQVKLKRSKQKEVMAEDLEKECLYRIVEAEAGGQDMKGRILVANVILNRVRHKHFPSTIRRVVFAHEGDCYQFSPIQDGRYKTVHVKKSTKEACDRALSGEDYSQGAFYFMNRESASEKNIHWFDTRLKFLFKHGGHEFFTLKS